MLDLDTMTGFAIELYLLGALTWVVIMTKLVEYMGKKVSPDAGRRFNWLTIPVVLMWPGAVIVTGLLATPLGQRGMEKLAVWLEKRYPSPGVDGA